MAMSMACQTAYTKKRTVQRRVKEVRGDRNIGLQERSLMRHNSPRELMLALILLSVGSSGGAEQRYAEDIATAGEAILAL